MRDKYPKSDFLLGLILKEFVKGTGVNEATYKNGSQTAPAFLIKYPRNFEVEKEMSDRKY